MENAQGSIDYNWFPDSNLTNPTSANPYFQADFNRKYKVIVTDDSGCVDSTYVFPIMKPGYTDLSETFGLAWESRYGGQDSTFTVLGDYYNKNHQTYLVTAYEVDSCVFRVVVLIYDTLGAVDYSLILNEATETGSYYPVDFMVDQRNGSAYITTKYYNEGTFSIVNFKVSVNGESRVLEEEWENTFATSNNDVPNDLDIRAIGEEESDSLHVGIVGYYEHPSNNRQRLTIVYDQKGELIDSIDAGGTTHRWQLTVRTKLKCPNH